MLSKLSLDRTGPNNLSWICRLLAACCLCAGFSVRAIAQPSNIEVFQQLATQCLSDVPPENSTVVLNTTGRMPYIRPALTNHWKTRGITVNVGELQTTDPTGGRHYLSFQFEDPGVSYTLDSGGHLMRNVSLTIQYILTTGDGDVLSEERCTQVYEDRIHREVLSRIESDEYPETQASFPAGGTFRRVLEPAVVASVIAVVTYLFFTVRSRGE